MTNQEYIEQIREDMKQINSLTGSLDVVSYRTKVNDTTYLIRLNRFPSIRYGNYEYVGRSNKFFIYRQRTSQGAATTSYQDELMPDTSNYSGDWQPYRSNNR